MDVKQQHNTTTTNLSVIQGTILLPLNALSLINTFPFTFSVQKSIPPKVTPQKQPKLLPCSVISVHLQDLSNCNTSRVFLERIWY